MRLVRVENGTQDIEGVKVNVGFYLVRVDSGTDVVAARLTRRFVVVDTGFHTYRLPRGDILAGNQVFRDGYCFQLWTGDVPSPSAERACIRGC